MTCPINAFYAETEGVMPLRTGESVKALPRPALPVVGLDDDCTDLDLIESVIVWLIVGIGAGITAYAVALLAARF